MDENFISLKLPDDWEEYRPREINLDTLTIWLGHKNPYPPLLALTPDDPNFSEDLLHPRSARYDYRTDIKITEYPNQETAGHSLDNYMLSSDKENYKQILINMGCRTLKGEFLGEKAVFFIDQNNQKFCSAVQINDFILTGSIFNYSALPSGKTPIHSSTCVLTSYSHNNFYCRCACCRNHPPCSTIQKEGLVYPEKVEKIIRQIFRAIRNIYVTSLKLKTGVSDANLKDVIKNKYDIILKVFKENNGPQPVITSTNDGDHKPNSRHYSNEAIDLQGHDMDDDLMQQIANDLAKLLGKDYDVLAEFFPQEHGRNHINIEYDPK